MTKTFRFGILDQPAQEVEEDLGVQGPVVDQNRSVPKSVTLEIIDWVNRAAGRGITGVSPCGAKLRP